MSRQRRAVERDPTRNTSNSGKKRRGKRAKGWTYAVGEKGKTRVRLFERHDLIWIDYRTESGERVRNTLGHADRERAKLEADEIVARFRRAGSRPSRGMTLSKLFDIYDREVTPGKSAGVQAHDRRTMPLFLKAFGRDRRPSTLSVRDWSNYITQRRSGQLSPKRSAGQEVRDRIIEQDCKLLLAILNWAERAGDGYGGYLLDKNPLRGLTIPREESPRRPIMTAELLVDVLKSATAISSAAELFVVLLWYTGHRAASVRQLRWPDIDLDRRTVRWRPEVDKVQYDHTNPLHAELVPMLERGRAVAELTGETFLFPSGFLRGEPMTRQEACTLWRKIADGAGIKPGTRLGTHSFRRAFANRLRDVNLRDLKDLGGWKTEKTVVGVYLQPDQDAQRAALARLSGAGGISK
jgi:integrase